MDFFDFFFEKKIQKYFHFFFEKKREKIEIFHFAKKILRKKIISKFPGNQFLKKKIEKNPENFEISKYLKIFFAKCFFSLQFFDFYFRKLHDFEVHFRF